MENNELAFFMQMVPPTVTHQEHKVAVRNGRPVFYEPPELKAARQKLLDNVARHAPDQPLRGPVRLITKWIWPGSDLEWKITKPDTDNMIKLLKDCMTKAGFWIDDAQVASEVTEKFLGAPAGIYVWIQEISEVDECR